MKMKRYSSIVLSVLVTGIVVLGSVFLSSNRSYALRQYMERKMEIPSADVKKISGNMAMTVGKIGFGRDTPQEAIRTLLWEVDGDFNLGALDVMYPMEDVLIKIDARTGTLDYTSEVNKIALELATNKVDQIIAGSHKGSSMPTMTLLANGGVTLRATFVRKNIVDDPQRFLFDQLLLHAVEGEVTKTKMKFLEGEPTDRTLVVITPDDASNKAIIKFGIAIKLRGGAFLQKHIRKSGSKDDNWNKSLGWITFHLLYNTG